MLTLIIIIVDRSRGGGAGGGGGKGTADSQHGATPSTAAVKSTLETENV